MKFMDKGSDKKQAIFETALRLFNRNGFEKTPTSRIAGEAGVSTGILFYYFKTKEELVNALYLRCKEEMVRCALLGVEGEKTYQGRMRRVYRNVLRWGLEHTGEYLFFQQFSSSAAIQDRTRAEGLQRFEPLRSLFHEGREQEIVLDAPEEYLLTTTAHFMMGTLDYLLEHRELAGQDAFLETTFQMLWNSVRR